MAEETSAAAVTKGVETLQLAHDNHKTAHPGSLPRTVTKSLLIDSTIVTDIWIQFFRDRLFIGISQLQHGRIGTYLLCQALKSEISPRTTEFETTHLLGGGRDEGTTILQTVYARQLLERLQSQEGCMQSTLVLGIALGPKRGGDRAVMRAVIDAVAALYRQEQH
jgi:hypothetical protein